MSDLLPLAVAQFALGIGRRALLGWAKEQRLRIVVERGKQLLLRVELERAFGPIDGERLADAWAKYKRGEHTASARKNYAQKKAVS